jgi:hypothetical protein
METSRSTFQSKGEKWTETFARFGIISKGIVYCLVGVLTFMAALGMRGENASKNEAFKLIYEQPFGKILLIIVAVGLLGYVTWRFFQSVYDIDSKGNDTNARLTRIGYGFSALIYFVMAIYAMKLALAGAGGGEDSQKFVVSKILEYPAGEWIIGIAGLLIIGNGIRQIYTAVTGNFMKNVQVTSSKHIDLFRKAGIAGYVARGVVLLIIGYFFLRAALHHNANEAIGTKEAFSFLQHTFGSVLMGVVAAGLIGYGVFMFVKGRYQKIDLNF